MQFKILSAPNSKRNSFLLYQLDKIEKCTTSNFQVIFTWKNFTKILEFKACTYVINLTLDILSLVLLEILKSLPNLWNLNSKVNCKISFEYSTTISRFANGW